MGGEEFKSKMQDNLNAFNNGEYTEEEYHQIADQLMEDTLTKLGYGEGIKIFKSVRVWYA